MGLLDALGSDDAKLGIALLSASGYSPTPMSFGQRLGGALGQYNADRTASAERALKLKLLQSQVDENASQNMLRQGQLERQKRQDEYFLGGPVAPMTAPGGGAPAASAAPTSVSPGSVLKSATGVPADAPPPGRGKFAEWSQQYGIPVDALVSDYMSNGGKGIAEMIYKRGAPDVQLVNGVAIDKNKTTNGQILPFVNTSANGTTTVGQVGPDGQLDVSAPRGAIDTAAGYARATAIKPIQVWNPEKQRMDWTTEGAVADAAQPQVRPRFVGDPLTAAVRQTESNGNVNAVSPKGAQGDMQVMPGTNTSPGFGVAPARDNSQAERTRVGEQYLKAMNDRYQNPTLAAIAYNWGPGNTDMWLKGGGDYNKLPAETQKYVSAVMTRSAVNGFGGQPQGGSMAAGPSAQEKSSSQFGEKMAGLQAEALDKSYTAANDASNALAGIRESRKAMQAGAYQGAGADFKLGVMKFGQALGVNLDPEKVANTDYLKSTLGNSLLEKAKTLGSNPSNADASRITDIVGSIGKDPQAMSKILDWQEEMSMKAINGHNTRVGQAEGNGFKSQFDLRVPVPEKPAQTSPQKQVLAELPKNAPKGQRIRDNTTGKILQWNGLQWKEE